MRDNPEMTSDMTIKVIAMRCYLNSPITLIHWRRTVAELYARVRSAPSDRRLEAWEEFRATRDKLFREHPDRGLRRLPISLRRDQGHDQGRRFGHRSQRRVGGDQELFPSVFCR